MKNLNRKLLGLLGLLVIMLSVSGCFFFQPQSEIVIYNDYEYINGYTISKVSLYNSDGGVEVSDFEPKTESGIFTFDGVPGGKGLHTEIYTAATGTVKLVIDYTSNGSGDDGTVEFSFDVKGEKNESIAISFCPNTEKDNIPMLKLR